MHDKPTAIPLPDEGEVIIDHRPDGVSLTLNDNTFAQAFVRLTEPQAQEIAVRLAPSLAAERDALIRYARALEGAVQDANDGVFVERIIDPAIVIDRMQAEHGVAALLEDDPR